MSHNRRNVIFETPFPIYCVRTLGDRHFLVAGGGGQAKTGVPNHLEIFLFDVHENSWDFIRTTAVDTGPLATMNFDLHRDDVDDSWLLACGQEGSCHVYKLKFDVVIVADGQLIQPDSSSSQSPSPISSTSSSGSVGGGGHSRRSRHRSSTTSISGNHHTSGSNLSAALNGLLSAPPGSVKKLGFSFEEVKSFQTDFLQNSGNKASLPPFQKVGRFNSAGTNLVTGGADGHFRVWEWPSCRKLLDHNAHRDDVDDLDVCPQGLRVVTVGRDGGGYVWQLKDATKLADLTQLDVTFMSSAIPPASSPSTAATQSSTPVKPTKYRYRFCRFAPALTTSRSHTFFTVSIPVVRNSKKQDCFLSRWLLPLNENRCRQVAYRTTPTGGEVVSTMAVSDNGAYLGLGTLGGSVVIVESTDLTPIQIWKEAHDIFVTAVDFLPTRPRATAAFSPLMSASECALVSCSANNTAQLHIVPKRSEPSSFSWLLWASIVFVLCFYLLVFFEL